MRRIMVAVLVVLMVIVVAPVAGAAPVNVRAVIVPGGVMISWQAVTGEVEIERRSHTEYVAVATVPSVPGTFFDADGGGSVTYRLRLKSLGGVSGWTGEISPEPTVIRLAVGRASAEFNGISAELDAPPLLFENRTYLPVRYLAEAVGATVQWDPDALSVKVSLAGRNLMLFVNSGVAQIDGWPVVIDPHNPHVVTLIVHPGRTMLPLRFVAEALGCTVDWDATSGEVSITYGAR